MSEIDFHYADGIFVKAITVPDAGSMVPQHAHCWDHVSFIAAGEVEAWCEGKHLGRFKAPAGIFIEKGKKHAFLTWEPNTVLLCIHSLHGEEQVAVLAEHQLTPDDAMALVRGARKLTCP